jgi:hypothetical protein
MEKPKLLTFLDLILFKTIVEWSAMNVSEKKNRPATPYGVFAAMKAFFALEDIPALLAVMPSSHNTVYSRIDELRNMGFVVKEDEAPALLTGPYESRQILLTPAAIKAYGQLSERYGEHWSYWPATVEVNNGVVAWETSHFPYN